MFDDIVSVLPRHSTDFERALEQASLWVIQNSEIVDVWNPETCPPRFLPWLAWSVSVDEWDPNWTDQQKRSVIKNSVKIHRIKGTRGSVIRALNAIGFKAEIEEWFETGGDPHTFKIKVFASDVLLNGFPVNEKLVQAVTRLIYDVKPARSHFVIEVGETFPSVTGVRSGVRSRERWGASISPSAQGHTGVANAAVVSHLSQRILHRDRLTPIARGDGFALFAPRRNQNG